MMTFGVLIDLDQTLVDSSDLKPWRDERDWRQVRSSLHLSNAYRFAVEFLDELSGLGFPYGIVTSSPRPYAEDMVRHHALPVRVLTAYHDTRAHKPHAAPLLHGLQTLGVSTGVYIGDDEIDARAAEAAGIDFLRVDHTLGHPLKDLAAAVVALAMQSAR
jgi:HAD superfamily hydrolase (TIGR01549 family)